MGVLLQEKKPCGRCRRDRIQAGTAFVLVQEETSSETRMKFQPYLRECMWDSGMQQEKRAIGFSGFSLLSSCAKGSLLYLNVKVFKTRLGF